MNTRALGICLLLAALPALAQSPATPRVVPTPLTGIEQGFRRLYELRFDEAFAEFTTWQKAHPNDPMGPTAEAAAYLFQEFQKQGVLSSDFFLDDDRLLGGIKGQPTPELRAGFLGASERGEKLVNARLKMNSEDRDALYAQAMLVGMLGNYRALIEKKHWEGVRLTEKAEKMAEKLLRVHPDALDAYLAIGSSNYIVGCLPKTKRFFLWFGGVAGEKEAGLAQLKRAAEGGRMLRPYAKIMLALASMREKDHATAQKLFTELAAEFPRNPQFPQELAFLKKSNGELSRP